MNMNNSESFSQNYQILQNIAQKLSQSGEVDIDELVPMVDQATQAYQLCKSRLDAVEEALSQRLDGQASQLTGQQVQETSLVTNASYEDDTPF